MQAKVTLQKKAEYCQFCGQEHLKSLKPGIRKFCGDHKTRGDSGIDDADRNYESHTGSDT